MVYVMNTNLPVFFYHNVAPDGTGSGKLHRSGTMVMVALPQEVTKAFKGWISYNKHSNNINLAL